MIKVAVNNNQIITLEEKDFKEILKVNNNNNNIFTEEYKGFILTVKGMGIVDNYIGYFCCYIKQIEDNEIINDILEDNEEVENETHFGNKNFGVGFDCVHSNDIYLNKYGFVNNKDNNSFKSKEYCFYKLKNVADKNIENIPGSSFRGDKCLEIYNK